MCCTMAVKFIAVNNQHLASFTVMHNGDWCTDLFRLLAAINMLTCAADFGVPAHTSCYEYKRRKTRV